MKTLKELRDAVTAIRGEIDAIHDKAETETRDLTKAELDKLDEINLRHSTAEAELDVYTRNLDAKDARQKRQDKANVKSEGEKISKRYSLGRAIKMQSRGEKLDGLEAEMHQEAQNEVRGFGKEITGLGIPSGLISLQKRASLTAEGSGTGLETVQTTVGDLIPFLRPNLYTAAMGATILTGLRGDLKLPRNNAVSSATWEGEVDANAESEPTFDSITLNPERLGLYALLSKQLVLQAEIPSVEAMLRRDIEAALGEGVDLAAINGSGGSNQPYGILNTASVNDITIATDGGALTRNLLVQFETEVATDKALRGRLGWLTTPGVRGFLKSTKVDAGSGIFLMNSDGNDLLGYPLMASTQVPSNLTKGAGTSLHAMIFGNWEELIIAQWGGLDLVVDPYTASKTGQITLVINGWYDIAVKHAASFCICNEINATIASGGE